jgi:hypothetical protein
MITGNKNLSSKLGINATKKLTIAAELSSLVSLWFKKRAG